MKPKNGLTDRQKFILNTRQKVNKATEKILKRDMAEYRRKFGFTQEDVWLWQTGCNIEVIVSFESIRQRWKA